MSEGRLNQPCLIKSEAGKIKNPHFKLCSPSFFAFPYAFSSLCWMVPLFLPHHKYTAIVRDIVNISLLQFSITVYLLQYSTAQWDTWVNDTPQGKSLILAPLPPNFLWAIYCTAILLSTREHELYMMMSPWERHCNERCEKSDATYWIRQVEVTHDHILCWLAWQFCDCLVDLNRQKILVVTFFDNNLQPFADIMTLTRIFDE